MRIETNKTIRLELNQQLKRANIRLETVKRLKLVVDNHYEQTINDRDSIYLQIKNLDK